MCEFLLLEVEAMPTHREQLWTNRFLHRESPSTDPLSDFFFFFFFLTSLLHRSILLSADKNLEHSNALEKNQNTAVTALQAPERNI